MRNEANANKRDVFVLVADVDSQIQICSHGHGVWEVGILSPGVILYYRECFFPTDEFISMAYMIVRLATFH